MAAEEKPNPDSKPNAGDPPASMPEPEAKTYTQAQLDSIIRETSGRMVGKVLKKLGFDKEDDAVTFIEEARKRPASKADGEPDESVQRHVQAATERVRGELAKQIEAKDADAKRWQGIAEKHAIENAIVAAATKKGARNVEHVAALLRGRVRFRADGSGVEVVDGEGTNVYGKDGKPISVDEFVSEWLTANDHFLPAGVKPGAGVGPSPGGGQHQSKTMTRAEFDALSPRERTARMNDGWKIASGR